MLFCEDAETVVRQSQTLKSVNNLQSGPLCSVQRGHSLPVGRRASRLPNRSVFIIQTLAPHCTSFFCWEMSTSCACNELRCHFISEIELMKRCLLGLLSCRTHRFAIRSREHNFYSIFESKSNSEMIIYSQTHFSANWICQLPLPFK